MITRIRYRQLTRTTAEQRSSVAILGRPMTAAEELEVLIRTHGPVRCVRVSSAPVGVARYGPYYGLVQYEVRLSARGIPTAYPLGAARRQWRSMRLAEQAAEASGRYMLRGGPGRVSSYDASGIVVHILQGGR